jgi:hypothetical protein
MNNSISIQFFIKMLYKLANSFFLQWDLFWNGGSIMIILFWA